MTAIALAFALVVAGADAAPEAAPVRVAITAARMLDVVTGKMIDRPVVLVEDGRITGVGSKLAIPSGFTVVDAGAETLLPGLIDVHTHLTWQASRR